MTGAAWLVPALAAIVAWAGSGALVRALAAREILDRPNPRSSHDRPTPRGAGLAVMAALAAAALLGTALRIDMGPPVMWLGAALLALVSWRDDLRGLGAGTRLAAQAMAVCLVVVLGGLMGTPLPWLPGWIGLGAAALAWLWFVNLFNFMDGIDGISAVETASIGLGVALVTLLGDVDVPVSLALAMAAAALGFLPWNWAPARIFLGDVGSIPLGFLLGWLLLDLAAAGAWAAALLLPAYYLADATATLARRARRGERLWQAHRDHYYQQAARRLGHAAVSARIALLNLVLAGCALLTTLGAGAAIAGLIVGAVSTVALMCYFRAPTHQDRPRVDGDRQRP